jgi:hypothetical protein
MKQHVFKEKLVRLKWAIKLEQQVDSTVILIIEALECYENLKHKNLQS